MNQFNPAAGLERPNPQSTRQLKERELAKAEEDLDVARHRYLDDEAHHKIKELEKLVAKLSKELGRPSKD